MRNYNMIEVSYIRNFFIQDGLRNKIFVPNLDAKQRLEMFQSLVRDEKILYAFREFLEHDVNWKINFELQNFIFLASFLLAKVNLL